MQTPSSLGKSRRFWRLFDPDTKRAVIAPLDDSLLAGPEGGLRNLEKKIDQVVAGGADGILAFYGLFAHYPKAIRRTSCILNITASTIRSTHTRKVIVGSVEQALIMDMHAVAVHVNMGSQHESEMLRTLGDVSRECQQMGMPLLALMYPRTEKLRGGDDNYYDLLRSSSENYAELVRHAVRIGVEMGADIIKTPYTGTSESFASVVQSACGVPVVTAGGPEVAINVVLDNAYGAIQAGAAGFAGGRNAFHRRDAAAVISALRNVVHDGMPPPQALAEFDRLRVIDNEVYEDDLPRGTTFMPSPQSVWIDDDVVQRTTPVNPS